VDVNRMSGASVAAMTCIKQIALAVRSHGRICRNVSNSMRGPTRPVLPLRDTRLAVDRGAPPILEGVRCMSIPMRNDGPAARAVQILRFNIHRKLCGE